MSKIAKTLPKTASFSVQVTQYELSYHSQNVSWQQAQTVCTSEGGALPDGNRLEQLKQGMIQNSVSSVWLGVTKTQHEGPLWFDGTQVGMDSL